MGRRMPYEQNAQPADVGAKTRSAAASKLCFVRDITIVNKAFYIPRSLYDLITNVPSGELRFAI